MIIPPFQEPSAQSRAAVVGSIDTHVHIGPDLIPRRITDVELARRCRDVGLAGFVLKSHYVPTAERAAVVRQVVPEASVYGAITLNAPVGGMNPVAVEVAARSGARIVWMPTVDSVNQRTSVAAPAEGSTPPLWAALQEEFRAAGLQADPVAVVDDDGALAPGVAEVLAVIARHDMVLATGHLAGLEILQVVRAASDAGVRRIVVTHPEFTSQRLSVDQQRELTDMGALMERCFTTPHTGKVTWNQMIHNIRQVGVENSVLSSDLGQPANPPVEDGLALMADHLVGAGFTYDDVHQMAVVNSRALIGEAPYGTGVPQ